MKIITSEDLKSRLFHAEANGSIIASDILVELKLNADAADILRGNANYFSTKRKKRIVQIIKRLGLFLLPVPKI
jgi:hypothetical protein